MFELSPIAEQSMWLATYLLAAAGPMMQVYIVYIYMYIIYISVFISMCTMCELSPIAEQNLWPATYVLAAAGPRMQVYIILYLFSYMHICIGICIHIYSYMRYRPSPNRVCGRLRICSPPQAQ